MHPASEFLAALGKERITAQTFTDREGGNVRPQILHGPHEALARRLGELNARGAGVFVCVNHTDLRGRRAENVTSVAAYFADFDGNPLPDSWPLPPTITVESSPGRYHAYWRTTNAPLEHFTHVQKHLVALFGSDDKVVDLPRVMRLPGYLHQKAEPFTPRLLEVEPANVYEHALVVEAFAVPRPPRPMPAACVEYMRRHQRTKPRSRDDGSPGIDRALQQITTAGQGNRNHTLFKRACAVANDVKNGTVPRDEAEQALLNAALQTGLPEHEARNTIHSAMRFAR